MSIEIESSEYVWRAGGRGSGEAAPGRAPAAEGKGGEARRCRGREGPGVRAVLCARADGALASPLA